MSWEDVIKSEGHGKKRIEVLVKKFDKRIAGAMRQIASLEKDIEKMKVLKEEFEELLEKME